MKQAVARAVVSASLELFVRSAGNWVLMDGLSRPDVCPDGTEAETTWNANGQPAATPGRLRRQWAEALRRTLRYTSDASKSLRFDVTENVARFLPDAQQRLAAKKLMKGPAA